MESRFVTLWVVTLSLLIAACDMAPTGSSQAHEDKPSGNKFGGIPIDNEDSSNTERDWIDPYDVDVPAWERRAASGDANAQFALGEVYRTGNTVTADAAKAVAWFEKAAEQRHVEAQFILGEMYENGEGVSKDLAKAVAWYEKAANAKSTNYFDQYDDQSQINERPQTKAQFRLGWIYNNEGILQDIKKSTEWYEQAAKQGMARAQHNLAVIYFNGKGVIKDTSKAFEWSQKAAMQGLAEAQFVMGEMYRKGDGVAKDVASAVEWHQKAAAQGLAKAQSRLGLMYSEGIGLPKNAAKAVDWYQRAAAQGLAGAQTNLGTSYARGEGTPKDHVLAYAWFNLAASQTEEGASDLASKNRTISEQMMSAEQIAEAQRLSSTWQPGQVLRREAEGGNTTAAPDEAAPGGALKKTATGTLFVVSTQGQSITNAHVVKDCAELRIESREGLATVMTTDAVNDLALIQIPGTVTFAAPIAKEPGKIRQGEDVVVFGFPLNAVLSSGGNLTPGVVSAMTGLGNNSNQIQITAPIQPGSSGSSVLNKKGEVVGVVSMKLSDAKMAAATGSVGQNVNFAVSGQTLKAFLDAHEVNYKDGVGYFSLEKTSAELADDARKWTLVVECWK